jgi:hypothetical protein
VTDPGPAVRQFPPRTAWALRLETPLRRFVRTETGSAAVLLAATLAALAWANIDPSGYAHTWHTELSIRIGNTGLAADLREWVNSGLMAFFFLVAGLEARREFDMGELRIRRRLALPLVVGLGGMIVPIGIYLALNAGRASAVGWGTAMSTDTAFALGLLALVGAHAPDRVSTYLLTFAIVDDVAGIMIIALAYSRQVHVPALAIGLAFLALVIAARTRHPKRPVLPATRTCCLDRLLRIRCQPGADRPLHRADCRGLPGHPDRSGAGVRVVPAVPRAADTGSGQGRAGERADGDLAE